MRKKQHAFTLIELSIVLVIIGLIVGGVLVGQDLIRAANLRAVAGEYQSYQTAMHSFRLKYNGLVGDINNASTFFSGARDGDGNKRIDEWDATNDNEHTAAWHHLASAGLIGGTFDPTFQYTLFSALPESKLSTAVWAYWHHGQMAGGPTNGLSLQNNKSHSGKVLRPREAWDIDQKLDDGLSRTGRVRGGALFDTYDHSTCLTNVASGDPPLSNDTYELDSDVIGCVMWFQYDY